MGVFCLSTLLPCLAVLAGDGLLPVTGAPASSAKVQTNTVAKEYSLPELGTLHLQIPAAWKESFQKTIVLGSRVDEINLSPREGAPGQILLQIFHMREPSLVLNFDTRKAVAEVAAKELDGSDTTSLDIQTFSGGEVSGSYVTLEDPHVSTTDPKPGEFRFLTQAYAKFGPALLGLRMVSNTNDPAVVQAVLNVVKSARLVPGTPP